MSESYNGYANYETWNVALWLDNEQSTYYMVKEWAEEASDSFELAGMLKDFVNEQNPLGSDASMFSDLLSAAISEVDFEELAENYFNEYHTEDEPEEEDEEETEEDQPLDPELQFVNDGIDETFDRLYELSPQIAAAFWGKWATFTS